MTVVKTTRRIPPPGPRRRTCKHVSTRMALYTLSPETHLGQETLVKSAESLLLGHSKDGRPSPVVLGNLTGDLGGVLDSALDHVEGRVEDGSDSATDTSRDHVVDHLALLGVGLGEELSDLEDAAEVAGVPEDVAPHGTLEALVQGEGALVLDRLDDAVDHAVVLSGRGLVLQADLDELEGHHHEGLGGSGRGAREDGELLVHRGDAKQVSVDLAPFVVGGELGGSLGSLHEDGRRDAAVESREAIAVSIDSLERDCWRIGHWHLPLLLDDLAEAVKHAIVGVGAGGIGLELAVGVSNWLVSWAPLEELHSGLDDIKRVPGEIC